MFSIQNDFQQSGGFNEVSEMPHMAHMLPAFDPYTPVSGHGRAVMMYARLCASWDFCCAFFLIQ
jgi:hypothetical protein